MKTDRIYRLTAAVALLATLPAAVDAQTFTATRDTTFVVTPADRKSVV